MMYLGMYYLELCYLSGAERKPREIFALGSLCERKNNKRCYAESAFHRQYC